MAFLWFLSEVMEKSEALMRVKVLIRVKTKWLPLDYFIYKLATRHMIATDW